MVYRASTKESSVDKVVPKSSFAEVGSLSKSTSGTMRMSSDAECEHKRHADRDGDAGVQAGSLDVAPNALRPVDSSGFGSPPALVFRA
ncbi:hypothetical protein MRX96_036230 [Rhipicephalus microplus]